MSVRINVHVPSLMTCVVTVVVSEWQFNCAVTLALVLKVKAPGLERGSFTTSKVPSKVPLCVFATTALLSTGGATLPPFEFTERLGGDAIFVTVTVRMTVVTGPEVFTWS
jgi:hypothetical protein